MIPETPLILDLDDGDGEGFIDFIYPNRVERKYIEFPTSFLDVIKNLFGLWKPKHPKTEVYFNK